MAKLPFLPRNPVLWRRSSSIGMYPALKLLLCSLLTFLRSTAFSRIDFFTGPLELCYNAKHRLAVIRHVNTPKGHTCVCKKYTLELTSGICSVLSFSLTLYLEYTFTTTAISANVMTKIKIQIFSDNVWFHISFLS